MPYALLTTHYALLTTHYVLRTAHYSLLPTPYSLLTPHHSLLTAHYSLLTPYQAAAAACPRAVPRRLRGGRQRRGHPHSLWLGRHACGKGRLGEGTSCRFGHLGRKASGLGCSAHSGGAPQPRKTPEAACGAASLPCPRPVYLLLPLTTYHLPPITYHSLRSTTCSQCRPISRRRPIPQQPRWATHSPRSPLSPQHDRASSSPPPRSTRCASAGRAAAASQARAPPSPQACGRCSRQPRCSPTAPPTGAAAPACCNPMHQGLQPSELGLQPNVARAALTLTCVAGTAVSTRCVCY